jgi:hypothetical protein
MEALRLIGDLRWLCVGFAEAYVLDPNRRGGNMYGGSVLDTIVEKIEGSAGSDMAVIMAGYEHQMHAMFRNSGNAGLNRRFNLSEALRFEDFSDNELLTILKRNVSVGLLDNCSSH